MAGVRESSRYVIDADTPRDRFAEEVPGVQQPVYRFRILPTFAPSPIPGGWSLVENRVALLRRRPLRVASRRRGSFSRIRID